MIYFLAVNAKRLNDSKPSTRSSDNEHGNLSESQGNGKSREGQKKLGNIGLDKWAREEAGGILDKYFYGAWTL